MRQQGDKNLIFDIGLHKGLDANFYLRKGFRVVGLEAVPELCAKAKELNKEYSDAGFLTIVNRALFTSSNKVVDFYVNPEKDDWGSLFQSGAEKGVGHADKISVETTTLQEIIDTYGLPYYIKCDIEGGDAIFCEQLIEVREQPHFISVEATRLDDLAFIRAAGYDRFQIINQYFQPWTHPPQPAREGAFVEINFSHEMSGLFGRELNSDKWIGYEDALRQFEDWHALYRRNPHIMVGWLDIHATRQKILDD